MIPAVIWTLRAGTDDVTRDSARQAAERELIKPEYHHVKPLLVQFFEWLLDHVMDLLGKAADAAPGGALGLVGILVLVVGTLVLIRYRVGALAATARRQAVFDVGRPRTAAEHRAAAEEAAGRADWLTAVQERFRGLVRALEERAVLEPRLGRTADEAAAESALVLPRAAAELRVAAGKFDDVVYGGRIATEQAYLSVVAADELAAQSQPVLA